MATIYPMGQGQMAPSDMKNCPLGWPTWYRLIHQMGSEIFMPLNLTTPLDWECKCKGLEDTFSEAQIIINDVAINVMHEKMIDIMKCRSPW